MDYDKSKNKLTGNSGEDAAAIYLEKNGYRILGRNIRYSFGEIDILAKDRNTIVIVEVKSVKGSGFGSAQELVRYKKQNKLKLLAQAVEQQYPNMTIRIDVIGVELDHFGRANIDHLINAVW